jgi:CelD/BcsL family acetyltransferase involved in cellulose biosynthesis
MLRTAILEHPHDMRRIRPLWEELAAQPGMTMFQSYVWNRTAVNVFRQREIPRFVYAESDGGAVLVPTVVGQRCGLAHLAGEALFDYRNALVLGDASLLCRAWMEIAEWGLTLEAKGLRGEQAIGRWSALPVVPFAKAPRLDWLQLSAHDFVSAHNRLGRFARRLRRQGVELRKHSGARNALVRRIYEKKAQQDVSTNLFRDPLRREFMMAIAEEPEAHCEIFTYETAGELVAALVTFRDREARRFYTTYFDQRWAADSPGQVLLFEVTAESLLEGLDCDYMTGEYAYKNRFATDAVPLYQLRATATQLRTAAQHALMANSEANICKPLAA